MYGGAIYPTSEFSPNDERGNVLRGAVVALKGGVLSHVCNNTDRGGCGTADIRLSHSCGALCNEWSQTTALCAASDS